MEEGIGFVCKTVQLKYPLKQVVILPWRPFTLDFTMYPNSVTGQEG